MTLVDLGVLRLLERKGHFDMSGADRLLERKGHFEMLLSGAAGSSSNVYV
jgi:hypothetical protein